MPSNKLIGGTPITDDDPLQVALMSDQSSIPVGPIVPGTGATNLGKAEDAVHASGDVGVMALAVRNDTAATTLAGTNGDYAPISVDANGRLFVNTLLGAASIDGFTNIGYLLDITGNARAAAILPYLFNGTSFDRQRTPNVFKNIAAVAVTAATPVTAWDPAAGKKFCVMGFALSLSVAGSVILKDGSTEILRTPLMAAGVGIVSPDMGNGIPSTAADANLSIDVTASGSVSGFLYGIEI